MLLISILALLLSCPSCDAEAAIWDWDDPPQTIQVQCFTTVDKDTPFVLDIKPAWAPIGAKRFLALVNDGFFNNVSFFRVVPNFLVQFGLSGDPKINKKWKNKGGLTDDPKRREKERFFQRGYLSFAGQSKHSRSTEVFIATQDGENLGSEPWETPIGFVSSGMEIIDGVYSLYGDMRPYNHKGPNPTLIMERGNEYLSRWFPELSYIQRCEVINNPSRAWFSSRL